VASNGHKGNLEPTDYKPFLKLFDNLSSKSLFYWLFIAHSSCDY